MPYQGGHAPRFTDEGRYFRDFSDFDDVFLSFWCNFSEPKLWPI